MRPANICLFKEIQRMENTTPEKRSSDEDEFAAQSAVWRGAAIFIMGAASYILATFGMLSSMTRVEAQ